MVAVLALSIFFVSHSTVNVDAFGVVSPFHRVESHAATAVDRTASTALAAQRTDEGSRRGFFSGLRKLLLGTGAASIIGGRVVPALAEDAVASSGNIVEIVLANLDGSESSGTIKIQMKPEWAPRGVARFEVSDGG